VDSQTDMESVSPSSAVPGPRSVNDLIAIGWWHGLVLPALMKNLSEIANDRT